MDVVRGLQCQVEDLLSKVTEAASKAGDRRQAQSDDASATRPGRATAALGRPAPEPWVTTADVERQMQCARSTAHAHLRAAAGRHASTGKMLRVPPEVWERYARENLAEGRSAKRWPTTSTDADASGGASSTSTAGGCDEVRAAPTKRQLGPFSPPGSRLPPIRSVKPRKRP
jgi:hypothetical protein